MFTRLIRREEEIGIFHGIKIDRNTPAIFHLLHADGFLLMCRANLEETEAFKMCFDTYCRWSGQEVNMEKSNVYFSRKTSQRDRSKIMEATRFREMEHTFIYLGNSLILGRSKTKEFILLKERIQKKLEGWRRKTLSKAGKAVLINSIIQAIPTYTMATFKVPIRLTTEVWNEPGSRVLRGGHLLVDKKMNVISLGQWWI